MSVLTDKKKKKSRWFSDDENVLLYSILPPKNMMEKFDVYFGCRVEMALPFIMLFRVEVKL